MNQINRIFTCLFLTTYLVISGFIVGCMHKSQESGNEVARIKLDSSLSLGDKIQFLSMNGRVIAFNPDSANTLMIIGRNSKVINSIKVDTTSNDWPHSFLQVAIDNVSNEIFVYCASQHYVFVFNSDGEIKQRVAIKGKHEGTFGRLNGAFVFFDRKDSLGGTESQRMYKVDSVGHYVDELR